MVPSGQHSCGEQGGGGGRRYSFGGGAEDRSGTGPWAGSWASVAGVAYWEDVAVDQVEPRCLSVLICELGSL